METRKCLFFVLLATLVAMTGIWDVGFAQEEEDEDVFPYEFTIETEVDRTPVKNQYRTGTCWCFSTISFFESEVLRKGGPELDLSEMYVVRHTYPKKAMNYIRLHGTANFGQGGQSHDVVDQVREFGLVPESVYSGMRIDEKRHNHREMFAVLDGMLDGVLKRRDTRVTPRWMEAFESVLDVYLGVSLESFEYEGRTYTPDSYFDEVVGLDLDEYVELTSYTHQPYYEQCRLELPDNWTYNADYYNVPMEDLERIADHALENGYSFVWDGDVSEPYFSSRETGLGLIPLKDWEDHTADEKDEDLTEIVEEKEITPELRQKTFDNFETTDDHLMHVVGIAHDQNGSKFYLTKNSGGLFDRAMDGYVYMSEAYYLLKTTALFVHKDSIPKDLRKKLDL